MSEPRSNDDAVHAAARHDDSSSEERSRGAGRRRDEGDIFAGTAEGQSRESAELGEYRYLRAFSQPPAAAEEREFVEDGFEGDEVAAGEAAEDEQRGGDEEEDAAAEAAQAETAQDPEAEGRRRLLVFRRDMRRRVRRLHELVRHNQVPGSASAHLYLGLNMQELPASDGEETEHDVVELPLVLCPGVILFPGEVLPLRITDPAQVTYLSSLIEPQPDQPHRTKLAVLSDGVRTGCIGTIAEIKSRRMSHGELILIGEGAKRFKLLRFTPNARPGLHLARVEILKDVEQPWRPMKKHCYDEMSQPFPSWVYEPYHVETLMEKAERAMVAVQGWRAASAPSSEQEEAPSPCKVPKNDPLRFSYWLSANLPLGDSSRQELLEMDDASLRLRRCVEHLERIGQMYLCCRHCRLPISQKQHIVTVPGAGGTVGAYVNPHGVVHQTVTVSELVNDDCILYDPQPSTTEDTWFPNYAWRIAYCRRCFSHLGWKFTSALEDAELPAFWGLSRRSIDDRSASEAGGEQVQQAARNLLAMNIPLAWRDVDLDEDQDDDDDDDGDDDDDEEDEGEAGGRHVLAMLQQLRSWLGGAQRGFPENDEDEVRDGEDNEDDDEEEDDEDEEASDGL